MQIKKRDKKRTSRYEPCLSSKTMRQKTTDEDLLSSYCLYSGMMFKKVMKHHFSILACRWITP